MARRTRGTGSVQTLEDGRVRARASVVDRYGRRHRPSAIGKDIAEAERKLRRILTRIENDGAPSVDDRLEAYLTGWLEREQTRVKGSTWRYRDGHVRNYIVPQLGRLKLGRIVPSDVEAMTDKMLSDGLSPRTAAGARVTLRKALADALRDGLVRQNAAALARPPRVPSREVEYYTPDELRAVLGAFEGVTIEPIVTIAAYTGLRQGEVLGLTVEDVGLEARTITVRRSLARDHRGGWELAEPKTARARRVVHLPERVVCVLRELMAEAEGRLFPDVTGTAVSQTWRATLLAANLRALPFHALRHTFATMALAAGAPIQAVADTLGHSSITITHAFYAGHVPQQGRDIADAIGGLMDAEPGYG